MQDLLPVFIQFPLLAIFIWYTLELMKRQEIKDEKHLEALNKITERLEQIKEILNQLQPSKNPIRKPKC
ncbi:MAG: hypothetical protein ANABAC_3455 [Anaerolineae bacterium]|jgi:hypothetical protein|nr:MAG: hypothetical protein ANABAC_3455 [Anaerolineae bacterium]